MAVHYCLGCLTILCIIFIGQTNGNTYSELPHCVHQDVPGSLEKLIFVSTLDGRMTALNAVTGGMIVWSLDTGPGPLLSSSIDKLELTSNGHLVRMIPSLSGGLYKFNGISVETVPITADHLLQSSSLLLSDRLVISGGRESRIYGIAFHTGEVLYECSMKGCDNYNVSDNIMVIQRHTQTVRAIDIHTGIERWNFSVGQHEVKYTFDSTCHKKQTEASILNFDVKAILPEGLVCAVDKQDPEKVLWKHKFDSPIVSVWQMENGEVKPVDLFSDIQQQSQAESSETSPALYIGMHKKQLYIQESGPLLDRTQRDPAYFISHQSVEIPWKPVPASKAALGITSDPRGQIDYAQTKSTAVSVWSASASNGYYLFINSNMKHSNQCSVSEDEETLQDNDNDGNTVNIVIISLWYWWKEVLIISITTAVVVNLLVTQRVIYLVQASSQVIQKEVIVEKSTKQISTDSSSSAISEVSQNSEFVSRYLSDFEPLQCLGKGGFGVVFEAKNKIDDCKYAIKRIILKNSLESRDKVLREVKALAKLDHQHIVRYFNAWMECPPVGWMEQHDLFFLKQEKTVNIIDIESTDPEKETQDRNITNGFLSKGSSLPRDSFSEGIPPNPQNCDNSDSFIVFENSDDSSGDERSCDRSGEVSVFFEESADSNSFSDKRSTARKNNSKEQVFQNDCRVPTPTKIYLYIQMQLCHRASLREWLCDNSKVRDRFKILQLFEQIVQAVEYIHLEGLIHRDLKPSNIFFSMNGQIKVGDFGLVTTMDKDVAAEDKVASDSSAINRDKHTALVGTQLYMSPEQLKGQPYDYKVDIYSLGVIFFELLYPFSTDMERIKTLEGLRKNVFPLNFQQDYYEEYDLLSLMLSHNPEKRPTTIGIRARPPLTASSSFNKEGQERQLDHFELPTDYLQHNNSNT